MYGTIAYGFGVVCTTIPLSMILFVVYMVELWYVSFLRALEKCGVIQPSLAEMTKVNGDMHATRSLPVENRLDFLLYRIPLYYINFSLTYPRILYNLATGNTQVHPMNDEELGRFILSGYISRDLLSTPDGGWYWDLTSLETMRLFEGCYCDVRGLRINAVGGVSEIILVGGNSASPGDVDWDLAKAHLQGCLLLVSKTRIHSWVHFVLPDVSAVEMQKLRRDGTLYELLYPHLRYTMRINMVTDNGTAITNRDNWLWYLLPWFDLPLTATQFVGHVGKSANQYYFGEPKKFLVSQEPRPPYVTFVGSYYECFLDLVSDVLPFIDEDELAQFVSGVSSILPYAQDIEPRHLLATLLHQVSVVHSCDHMVLANGAKYMCGYIRKPFLKGGDIESLSSCWDYLRAQVSSTWFSTDHKNPFQPLRLMDCTHNFSIDSLCCSDERFREKLRHVDQELSRTGLNIVSLSHFNEGLSF